MARMRERSQMPSLEERVAYLEGRMEDHTSSLRDLRGAMDDLREHMDRGFGDLRAHVDRGFGDLWGAVDDLREQMGNLREQMGNLREQVGNLREQVGNLREQMGNFQKRFEALDRKVDHHFTWLVGIQVAVLVAIVGTLLGSYYK